MVGRKEREVRPSEQETAGLAQLLSSADVYGRTTRYKGVKSIQPGMKEEANEWTQQRTFHH